ncbi:hypothetical protein CTAYLR_007075 [Chrysophaeum taylorii]|uniref:Prokaryotic-type class I peptide chain release factors domain-containing protein n=1 Tax=Chrysophaeum taylorii TaxID=2483200 RepID=A0AAD7UKA5_9STRA|nr:hypothetical protein CTAYLR_007075 [Chrysophaeum taylorii]
MRLCLLLALNNRPLSYSFALNKRPLSYLRLSDEALLRQCRVDYRRDSGPGGQKRNKIESAVRLTHEPTSIVVNAAEDRSQHRNKAVALRRLKTRIAHTVRTTDSWIEEEMPGELRGLLPWVREGPVGRKSDMRPLAEQLLLDALDAHGGAVGDCARFLGGSTGQLSKLLESDDGLFAAANAVRATHGLGPLRRRTK